MPVIKKNEMKEIKMDAPVLKNVVKQTAITPAEGWDGWVMRIFTLGEEGYSPRHAHPWPHINYIIEGNGTLWLEGRENTVSKGDTAFIPPGEEHQFKNAGTGKFSFICIVPEEGDK